MPPVLLVLTSCRSSRKNHLTAGTTVLEPGGDLTPAAPSPPPPPPKVMLVLTKGLHPLALPSDLAPASVTVAKMKAKSRSEAEPCI